MSAADRPILGIARTDHRVVIRRSEGGFYAVTVEPPVPTIEPRVFGDARSARGYAGGIRITTGFAKADLTGES